jgi:HD superfamily phosphohydrolase
MTEEDTACKNFIDNFIAVATDHPLVRRMTNVSQLGTISYTRGEPVYSRLEHMIGTEQIADRVCASLMVLDPAMTWWHCLVVRLAALLHDVGHLPFSHQFDQFLATQGAFVCHEQRSAMLARHIIQECVAEDADKDSEMLCQHVEAMVLGNAIAGFPVYLTKIVNAGNNHELLDLDRLDYLQRDAGYFVIGAKSYWKEVSNRLISTISLSGNMSELIFEPVLLKQITNLRKYLRKTFYERSRECNPKLFEALGKALGRDPYDVSTVEGINVIHHLIIERALYEMMKC